MSDKSDKSYLEWPFFNPQHKVLEQSIHTWVHNLQKISDAEDVDTACQQWVQQLGQAGWLRYAVAGTAYGGSYDAMDMRAFCLIRETLARHCELAEFAFAMQGLGSGAIALFGTDTQKQRYLPAVAKGESIAAFALSEVDAGSDAAALQCLAQQDEVDNYILNGEKTWVSNGGIADFYVLFARTGEAPGAKGISAFIVDADTPGLSIAERINVMAPHPLARLTLRNCHLSSTQRLGEAGEGFKIAMATLDVFRISVAAAALGFARRALDEALARVATRKMFGRTLADFQLTQAKLADMATGIDSAALLTYRAAWLLDQGKSITKEAAMAKMAATEIAQQVIDAALQMMGGLGLVSGQPVECLYREIRALRIYEGATEVQQLIIARELLRERLLQKEKE